MSDTIIRVENLSKSYFIGHEKQQGYTALRDVIAQKAKGFAKGIQNTFTNNKKSNTELEEFWALKDVNFEIKKGEAVGIIGRNGAGKSTLLKILSRITEPTKGRITLDGRVASLLEVGTGFHPELTGRENIYLNGSILGMTRVEIKSKFDEIVDFSGVEKFLDTPVKRYSSGMYVRLAFAVAAHLEPEILVVDEVLAVGDAEFQKKCLGKMNDVSKSGRTVLFVSHNLGAITELCKKSILLNRGKILTVGQTNDVLHLYNLNTSNVSPEYKASIKKYIAAAKISNALGGNVLSFEDSVELVIEINSGNSHQENASIGVALLDKWKRKIFTTIHQTKHNKFKYVVKFPSKLFLSGTYSVDIALFIPNGPSLEYLKDICQFEITDYVSEMAIYGNADVGILNLKCIWNEL